MNKLRTALTYTARNLKHGRKFYVELLAVTGLIVISVWLASIWSPYQPTRDDYTFYETDQQQSQLYRAEVESIAGDSMQVRLLDGPRINQTVTAAPINSTIEAGDKVIVGAGDNDGFYLYSQYRLPGIVIAIAVFVALAILIGRRRGMTSLLGLAASIIVVTWFIVPLILAGHSPLWICIAGAYIIAVTSISLAHGFNRRTFIALACIGFILLLISVASWLTVSLLSLSGMSSEPAYMLVNRFGIDTAGILAGGIIIASLGALDDVVTTQVATVDELLKSNPKLTSAKLFGHSISVGREHVAALVNTLALVYIGAALPLIVGLAAINQDVLLLANSDYLADEIIRTIIASSGLVLSVPISTLVAAIVLKRKLAISSASSVKQ